MSAQRKTEASGKSVLGTAHWKTFSRFSLVGAAATVTYFCVANLLMAITGMQAAHASVAAYLAGMVVSFIGQGRLTFMVRSHSWRQLGRFAALSAVGLAIGWLSVVGVMAAGYEPFWATVITAISIPVLSFLAMKFWVFAPTPSPSADT
jgi:putative flippase GtrA